MCLNIVSFSFHKRETLSYDTNWPLYAANFLSERKHIFFSFHESEMSLYDTYEEPGGPF